MGGAAPKHPAAKRRRRGAKPLIQYNGPFRIEIQQLSLVRDFQAGGATANIQIEVAWEPRLRPMLLKLKYDELKILDDRKKEVKPQAAMEADEVVIRPENPSAEINLNLDAPEPRGQEARVDRRQGGGDDPGRHQDLQVSQPRPEGRDGQTGRREPDPRGHRGRRTGLEGQRHPGLSR